MSRLLSIALVLLCIGYISAQSEPPPDDSKATPVQEAPLAVQFATEEDKADLYRFWFEAKRKQLGVSADDQDSLSFKLLNLHTKYPCDPWVDDAEAEIWYQYPSCFNSPTLLSCLEHQANSLKAAIVKYQVIALLLFDQTAFDRSLALLIKLGDCYRALYWWYYEWYWNPNIAWEKMEEYRPLILETYSLVKGNAVLEAEAELRMAQWLLELMHIFMP